MSEPIVFFYQGQKWLITKEENLWIGCNDCCEKCGNFKTTIPHFTPLQVMQDIMAMFGLCDPVVPTYEGDQFQIEGFERKNSIAICTNYPALTGKKVLVEGWITRIDPWQRFQINNDTWFEADDGIVYIEKEPTHE